MLNILIILVIALTNICTLSFISSYQTYNILYSKPTYALDYSNMEVDRDVMKHLIEFSKDNQINISQYVYVDENRINIYSTNISEDHNFTLVDGSLPYNHQYISNRKMNNEISNQSGKFVFPISNMQIRIYGFENIVSAGLGDTFYLSTDDKGISQKFVTEFSIYGNIIPTREYMDCSKFVDTTILSITITAYIGLFLILYFATLQGRNQLFVLELWGLSKLETLRFKIAPLIKFYVIIMIAVFAFLTFLSTLLKQNKYLISNFTMLVIINSIMLIIILSMMTLSMYLVEKTTNSPSKIKGQFSIANIRIISFFMKGILCIIILATLATTINFLNFLNKEFDRLNHWEKTTNIYCLTVGSLPEYKINNLKYDRELNDRLLLLYNKLVSDHNAFLIKSTHFSKDSLYSSPPMYSYNVNVTGEEAIYSPSGRSIVINENYLKMNPIYGTDKKTVLDKILYDNDTLNILVPIQYQKYEHKIKQAYNKYFYFMKVEVDNIYNKELGLPINNKDPNDLKINVIYIQQGQSYFTYNFYNGDEKNEIIDPIAIIYNTSVDTSFIGSFMTSSVYYYDSSDGEAFETISNSLIESNVPEVRMVRSVYTEVNNRIFKLKDFIFRKSIGLVITLIGSILFMIILIWSQYQLYQYDIAIQYLSGCSNYQRNKTLITRSICINLFSCAVFMIIYKWNYSPIAFLIISTLDLVLINIFGEYFCKNNLNKILKGDSI